MAVIGAIAIVSFLLSLWITRQLCVTTKRWQILDHPNERSLHVSPVPRTGGLAILLVILLNLYLATQIMVVPSLLYWLAGSLLPLAAVAWLDDRRGVPPVWRLAVQIVVTLMLLLGGGLLSNFALWGHDPLVGGVVLLAAVLFMVWMVNLYNFMDGMDGLAGGMAAIGFGCFAILGWFAGDQLFTWLATGIAGAASGFLVFNFPPARIFMGDTGSYSLGFLAAAFSFWGVGEGVFSIWSPVLIFSPFIVDATVTLALRVRRGERVWEAHRGHYYQRLAHAGWTHRSIVLWAYGLMAACSASVVLGESLRGRFQAVIVAIWIVLYTVLLRAIPWLEARQRSSSPP